MRTRNADKEQLVKQKAIEMFASDGFEGFSMNKLARACNISVATIYIYYKDRDDMIIKIAKEELVRMTGITLENFNANLSFTEGMRVQWKNRAKYMLENPNYSLFFEQLRSSTYQDKVFESTIEAFKQTMGRFMKNAVLNKEVDPMPLEVFWSVAFAPLYTLVRFNNEGRSIAGKPFTLTNKMLWHTFDLVIKALKK